MPATPLPSFENPPVVETVLGVQFSPVPKFSVPHFGLFWNKIRADYPKFETQPPIVSQIETFEQSQRAEQHSIQLVPINDTRCWYISEDDQHLVQLQPDRFLSNWRKGDTGHPYPRYDDTVKPCFTSQWARFLDFLKSESLDGPEIVQCEVTYVNHIRKGEGWETIAEWEDVFVGLGIGRESRFLPPAESLRFNSSYVIPERKGRLHVNAHHAIRISNQGQVIVFTLTARGKPESSTTSDILSWFDLGREWVVRGFTDLTSDKMHGIWKRLE